MIRILFRVETLKNAADEKPLSPVEIRKKSRNESFPSRRVAEKRIEDAKVEEKPFRVDGD